MINGYATLSTSLIAAVQRHIIQATNATDVYPMVSLPPSPSQTPPVPTIINTNLSQAGAAFGRLGSCNTHQSTDNSMGHISAVSINGQSYNGCIFDANGTRLA